MQTKIVSVGAPSGSYSVHIGSDLLHTLGSLCQKNCIGKKAIIITDDTVYALYAKQTKAALQETGYTVLTYAFPAGEASKTPQTLLCILEYLAQSEVTRKDILIALGGGVVGDITGLAAATYQRGMPYIGVPTTLLAAIDSSVGGKTAVNLSAGKNLMGVFYQPAAVVCDINTFSTLPKDVLSAGMAEAIKYGVLSDVALFDLCLAGPAALTVEKMITLAQTCVTIKAQIVAQDERDTGIRQTLNLGHTIGHAIEHASAYSISHGAAVGMGLYMLSLAAVRLYNAQPSLPSQIKKALTTWGLPLQPDFSAQVLYEAALHDKKRTDAQITIIIPHSIGCCRLKQIPITDLYKCISIGLEEA